MNIMEVDFRALKNDISYDEAPESVRMQLLGLVQCEVKQKKS